MKKTKIICTLGPSTAKEEVLEKMLLNGMNVARLNFSHGDYDGHRKAIETFRAVRDRLGVPAAIMLDTKGPEIRLKNFKDKKATLSAGEEFVLTAREIEGDSKAVSITYKDLPGQLRAGQRILIDDGKIILSVQKQTEFDIICAVIAGGEVSSRKSINIPNTHLNLPYLSEVDKKDILFGIEQGVDFIAASFVRSKEDVIALRKFID